MAVAYNQWRTQDFILEGAEVKHGIEHIFSLWSEEI